MKKKLNTSTVISSQSEQASAKEAEVPKKGPPVLNHHPSPPASSERRQVTVVGRGKALLSFNQLDGQEDISSLDAVPSSEEGEEDIVDVGDAERDVSRFCEIYKVPSAKVRCSKPQWGIGSFLEIDEKSENFVYEFQNGELVEF